MLDYVEYETRVYHYIMMDDGTKLEFANRRNKPARSGAEFRELALECYSY
jgi:hypothetical protein